MHDAMDRSYCKFQLYTLRHPRLIYSLIAWLIEFILPTCGTGHYTEPSNLSCEDSMLTQLALVTSPRPT